MLDESDDKKKYGESADRFVAEATGNRKEENADYKELMANDGTAKEVPALALARSWCRSAPVPPSLSKTFGPCTKKSEKSGDDT
eukprot:14403661-Heterocapsa_arctica.AAC.1